MACDPIRRDCHEMRVGVGWIRAHARVSRRGVGRALPRRPPPLRAAHARRRAGGSLVEHDPEQARGVSRGIRGLRPRGRRALRSEGGRATRRGSGNRPQPAQDRIDCNNAARVLEVQEELGSFDAYLWRFVDGEPIIGRRRDLAELPAETDESRALSKDLKRRGFRFVGPTICYAFMQTVGLVNDHTVDCFRFRELAR